MAAPDVLTARQRLTRFGIDRATIDGAVRVITAQRLVRRVCRCREAYMATSEELEMLSTELSNILPDHPAHLFRSVGCDACAGSGYRGRRAIFEVIPENDPVWNTESLRASAIVALLRGETTSEEILRVLGSA